MSIATFGAPEAVLKALYIAAASPEARPRVRTITGLSVVGASGGDLVEMAVECGLVVTLRMAFGDPSEGTADSTAHPTGEIAHLILLAG